MVTLMMGILSFLVNLGHDYCIAAVQPYLPSRDGPVLLATRLQSRAVTLSSGKPKSTFDRDSITDQAIHSHEDGSVKKTFRLNHTPGRKLFIFCFNIFRTLVLQGNLIPARSSPLRVILFAWYAFGIIIYG